MTSSAAFRKGQSLLPSTDQFSSRYTLTGAKLGSGKHSVVLQARSKLDGQTYAVKFIPFSIAGESAVAQEISHLKKIRHKYAAEMVDYATCSEQMPNVTGIPPPYACIVMRQVSGTSLSAKIPNGPNPALAQQILPQLASVLKDMHMQEIVHRDVWSENIILDFSGSAILLDFGSCTSPGSYGAAQDVNLPYLSPQVCQQQGHSPSDDMWALGLVLTEVITGQHLANRMGRHDSPFFSSTDLFHQHLEEACSLGGPQLAKICRRLLDFDAGQRATASDVLAMSASQSLALPKSFAPLQSHIGRNSVSASNLLAPQSNYKSLFPGSLSYRNALDLRPGQTVTYQAKSHNGVYQATVLERTPMNSWKIQVQGGEIKEVPDSERWRIRN
jgi:serine/threonine protein kinase